MLDSFIKTGATGDLGSIKAEVTATTVDLLEPFSSDFFVSSPPTPSAFSRDEPAVYQELSAMEPRKNLLGKQ